MSTSASRTSASISSTAASTPCRTLPATGRPLLERIRIAARHDADLFYIAPIEVLSVLLIAALIVPIVPKSHSFADLAWAFVLLILPVTQGIVDLVNNTVTALFEAHARCPRSTSTAPAFRKKQAHSSPSRHC